MKNKEREYSFVENDYNKPLKAWDHGVPFEDGAYEQAANMLSLPFVKGVSLMPDAHIGMGSTVGSVIVTENAIIPSAVGVDLGCGIGVSKLNIHEDDIKGKEEALFHAVAKSVPHGRTDNGGKGDKGRWHKNDEIEKYFNDHFSDTYNTIYSKNKYKHLGEIGTKPTWEHLGTLGSGNHFWEMSKNENGELYLLVHSGSRGMGARCGNIFMKIAKEECKKWFVDLVDPHLAYFPHGTEHFDYYLKALYLSQNFAKASRKFMLEYSRRAIEHKLGFPVEVNEEESFDCHHNYACMENHNGKNYFVTRKGAVRARIGDKCVIPGSMGDKTFLCEGLQNNDSFHSCSHGAGRAMSRTQALKQFSVEDHIRATEGVVCDKTKDVLDETPDAYKPISAVMAAQSTLVNPYAVLKQLICIKGADKKEDRK